MCQDQARHADVCSTETAASEVLASLQCSVKLRQQALLRVTACSRCAEGGVCLKPLLHLGSCICWTQLLAACKDATAQSGQHARKCCMPVMYAMSRPIWSMTECSSKSCTTASKSLRSTLAWCSAAQHTVVQRSTRRTYCFDRGADVLEHILFRRDNGRQPSRGQWEGHIYGQCQVICRFGQLDSGVACAGGSAHGQAAVRQLAVVETVGHVDALLSTLPCGQHLRRLLRSLTAS